MKLPDDTYVENGVTYLLSDRELVERSIRTVIKKGDKNVVTWKTESYVVSTRIRAPSADPDPVQSDQLRPAEDKSVGNAALERIFGMLGANRK